MTIRRKQYSSCDECRRSRVSCDAAARAALAEGQDVRSQTAACTRCLNRKRPCTFKWIKGAKGKVPSRVVKAANEASRSPASPLSPRLPSPRSENIGTTPRQRQRHGRVLDENTGEPAVASPLSRTTTAPVPIPIPVPSSEPHYVSGLQDQTSPSVVTWRGLPTVSPQTPAFVFPQGPSPALRTSNVTASSPSCSALSEAGSAWSPSSPSEVSRSTDAEWLQAIYVQGFEAIFGSWMGRYSCPFSSVPSSPAPQSIDQALFGDSSTAEKYVSISDLCGRLDQWMGETAEGAPDGPPWRHQQTRERDAVIDESLRSTISAFSARWIPLTCQSAHLGPDKLKVVQGLWRHARRDMLRVINRPAYRSMLALLLFALTPIPTGISENEEADGISGQACVHAALQQIQVLRARQRNLQFSGSKVSPSSPNTPAVVASPDSIDTSAFISAESTAYWAALTFDTSASLTLNCRPLLSSGLFGFEAESAWRLVRTCAQMFSATSESWKHQGDGSFGAMTDDRANQIIAAAAAWKLLGWKLTSVFKEALRDGHDETEIHKAYLLVVDSIKEFNSTFRHLLEACERRMQFLGQKTKLRWYSLMLHYHLSIMMFVDIIEATGRYDLLLDLGAASTDAESTVMNCLVFGLHNHFTLGRLRDAPNRSNAADCGSPSENLARPISIPLISMDPYPHHVVAGVQLLRKAIDRDVGIGKIEEDTYINLQSTLEQTLSLLPQSSKSVRDARSKFSEKAMYDEGSSLNPLASFQG